MSVYVHDQRKETYDVHGCTIPETVDLDVVGSLDEVGSGDGSVGNESGISVVLLYEWSSERSGCDGKGVAMSKDNQEPKR
jgi:hypothetical protein